MYATPSAYAAAPTMTSMYATPGASMYMPATTTTAAPVMAAPAVYAAPQVVATTQSPSFVAAPSVAGPQFAVPSPQSLTAGLVEPAKLEAERVAYERALAAQLKKQSDAVLEEAKIKKAMMEQTAKTSLAQYQLQIEEQLKMASLQLDQEAQNLINGLKEAAITQQTAREEQAAIAAADYLKKKALEEMSVKSYNLQKQWFEKETQLTAEYQQVMQKGSRSVVTSAVPQMPMAAPAVI
jgi:hypothetical protein